MYMRATVSYSSTVRTYLIEVFAAVESGVSVGLQICRHRLALLAVLPLAAAAIARRSVVDDPNRRQAKRETSLDCKYVEATEDGS